MESNIKGLVTAGHEMASELKAECGAVDMRSVAKLISDLATQLEVQLVRLMRWPKTNRKRLSQLSKLMRLLSWHTRSFQRWQRRMRGAFLRYPAATRQLMKCFTIRINGLIKSGFPRFGQRQNN